MADSAQAAGPARQMEGEVGTESGAGKEFQDFDDILVQVGGWGPFQAKVDYDAPSILMKNCINVIRVTRHHTLLTVGCSTF